MRGGYYFFLDGDTREQRWFDEFDFDIGSPIHTPQTAARHNECWMREYDNALVLLNPTKTAKLISLAFMNSLGNWKRYSGLQAPSVNNGANVTAGISLAGEDGLLLERQ